MRNHGAILLILMVMLLFAAPVFMQLSADNYGMNLLEHQVAEVVHTRRALVSALRQLYRNDPNITTCYTDAYTQSALDAFWLERDLLCQTKIFNLSVHYALYGYHRANTIRYRQYTLHAQNIWLRVVVEGSTGRIVSWLYY